MESQNLNLVKLSFQHLSQITMIIFKLNVPEINQNSQILRKSNLALKVGKGVCVPNACAVERRERNQNEALCNSNFGSRPIIELHAVMGLRRTLKKITAQFLYRLLCTLPETNCKRRFEEAIRKKILFRAPLLAHWRS